jgi:hypothetical protein
MGQRPLPALVHRYDIQKFIVLLLIALVIVGLLVAREYLYI